MCTNIYGNQNTRILLLCNLNCFGAKKKEEKKEKEKKENTKKIRKFLVNYNYTNVISSKFGLRGGVHIITYVLCRAINSVEIGWIVFEIQESEISKMSVHITHMICVSLPWLYNT